MLAFQQLATRSLCLNTFCRVHFTTERKTRETTAGVKTLSCRCSQKGGRSGAELCFSCCFQVFNDIFTVPKLLSGAQALGEGGPSWPPVSSLFSQPDETSALHTSLCASRPARPAAAHRQTCFPASVQDAGRCVFWMWDIFVSS